MENKSNALYFCVGEPSVTAYAARSARKTPVYLGYPEQHAKHKAALLDLVTSHAGQPLVAALKGPPRVGKSSLIQAAIDSGRYDVVLDGYDRYPQVTSGMPLPERIHYLTTQLSHTRHDLGAPKYCDPMQERILFIAGTHSAESTQYNFEFSNRNLDYLFTELHQYNLPIHVICDVGRNDNTFSGYDNPYDPSQDTPAALAYVLTFDRDNMNVIERLKTACCDGSIRFESNDLHNAFSGNSLLSAKDAKNFAAALIANDTDAVREIETRLQALAFASTYPQGYQLRERG